MRASSDASNAPHTLSVNHFANVESSVATHSLFMSVLQERRCKRGGGYRMRAKLYRPRFFANRSRETEWSGVQRSRQGEIRNEKTKNARFRRARGVAYGDNSRRPACRG